MGKGLITDWESFSNGNTALVLKDSISSSDIFTVSTNMNTSYPDNLIGVRSYEPYFRNALLDFGIIEEEVVTVEPSGMISIQFYELSKEAYLEMKQSKELDLNSKSRNNIENERF